MLLEAKDVGCVLRRVTSRSELVGALTDAVAAVRARSAGRLVVPSIHLAAHGDASGVKLVDEFVDWSALRRVLLDFAEAAGRMNRNGLALLSLTLSTCRGLHAREMFAVGPPYPCFGAIGCGEEVEAVRATEGFVRYYTDFAELDLQVPEQLRRMNEVTAPFQFEVALPTDVWSRISERGRRGLASWEQTRARPDTAPDQPTHPAPGRPASG